MSAQTHENVPSGPVSRRMRDRARFRWDIWRTDPNPIWIRELKQSVRLQRTPIILCVLTILMTLLIAAIGGVSTTNQSPATTGIVLFHVFFSLAFFVVTLVGPTVAANGIAAEREGRTWEAVLLTGLEPGLIARGKFLAAYTTISLYIVMLAPVGALPFLFGGVTATETIVAFLFLFLIASLAVAFGLAISSKMTSMRAAIAVTLLLALPLAGGAFGLFGPALSIAAHKAWPNVPEGPPIWLPTAYSRAPFDLTYIVALFLAPVLVIAIPAWFLYEVTIANLTSLTDDRTTGLKRWFIVCVPILAITAIPPIFATSSPSDRLGVTHLTLGLFGFVLMFCVFLFLGDAVGPSRRVVAGWAKVRAGALRRFLGPGLVQTSMLVLFLGLGTLAAVTAAGMIHVQSTPSHTYAPQQVALAGFTVAGLFTFSLGLGAYVRARSSGSLVARMVLAGTLTAVAIAPWVAAAILGVMANAKSDDALAIASPSPFYVFVAVDALDDNEASVAPLASTLSSAGWFLLGLILMLLAHRRARDVIAQHEEMLTRTDRLLDEEDAARDAANAPQAQDAGAAEPGATAEPAPTT